MNNGRFPRIDVKILSIALAACGAMVWAVSTIVAVNQRIGGEEYWTYIFLSLGFAGSLLIIVAAIKAMIAANELAAIDDQAKRRRREEGAYSPWDLD